MVLREAFLEEIGKIRGPTIAARMAGEVGAFLDVLDEGTLPLLLAGQIDEGPTKRAVSQVTGEAVRDIEWASYEDWAGDRKAARSAVARIDRDWTLIVHLTDTALEEVKAPLRTQSKQLSDAAGAAYHEALLHTCPALAEIGWSKKMRVDADLRDIAGMAFRTYLGCTLAGNKRFAARCAALLGCMATHLPLGFVTAKPRTLLVIAA